MVGSAGSEGAWRPSGSCWRWKGCFRSPCSEGRSSFRGCLGPPVRPGPARGLLVVPRLEHVAVRVAEVEAAAGHAAGAEGVVGDVREGYAPLLEPGPQRLEVAGVEGETHMVDRVTRAVGGPGHHGHAFGHCERSEERRGGEECRSRWSPYH